MFQLSGFYCIYEAMHLQRCDASKRGTFTPPVFEGRLITLEL